MKPAALRLVLAVLLFAGWVGYLAYLAATTRNPIVLSRPQFLVSQMDVIARIEAPPQATVEEIHWPDKTDLKPGDVLTVTNLADCQGWAGPGSYILALSRDGKDYRVAPTPPSPGYDRSGPPRIYPLTKETRHQLDSIPKPTAVEIE